MEVRTEQETIFQQALKDPILWFFLISFILAHIPYFLPIISSEQFETYVWFVCTVFLLPFIVMILWPASKKPLPGNERNFLKLLSLAFALWWVVSLVNLLWYAGIWTASIEVLINSVFLGFYICWLIALSIAPHHQSHPEVRRYDRWLTGTGVVVLSLFLFFYFILVPSRYVPESFTAWIPSLLFFAFLDGILTFMLVRLLLRAQTRRWKVLYGALAVNTLAFTLIDLLEALSHTGQYHWVMDISSDIIWSIPFLATVFFARARNYKFPKSKLGYQTALPVVSRPLALISPIILMAFILPVLHISLDQLGLIQEHIKRVLGAVVLCSLGAFWVLAVLENRSLRRVRRLAEVHAAENERLRVKQKVTEESELAKGQFLANVSHEIRTPMNGILGMSEIILRGKLSNNLRDQVDIVRSSAHGLLEVIDDILVHSKIEAGILSFKQEPFNLQKLAKQVLGLFRVGHKQQNIEMRLEFQDDMPLEFEGDVSRLRQVLVNLVGNALKFTTKGEVSVRFSLCGASGSKVIVRCEVIDSGIGVNQETLDKIFLPFSQADESTSRKYGGSGLGLSISKKIVEAQSGKIGVSSEPGKGSTFWFEIPYLVNSVVDEIPQQDLETEIAPTEGERILLAEDNEINQIVALTQLETLGKQVDVVSNGNEVLEAIGKHQYALILMDCQMPELDGIQATRQIRGQGYSQSDLPIIALTAHVFGEDRDRCIEAGMNDFLSKPLSLGQLSKTLTRWL